MRIEELQNLIANGESETLEFKCTTGQRAEAAKTICAMLNGIGGSVVFGVSDKGQIIGQHITSKTVEDVSIELRRIDPPIFPEIKLISIDDDKAAIFIKVHGERKIYTFNNRPYLRHGPTTQIMPRNEYERRLVVYLHETKRWENEPAPDTVKVSDLDEDEIYSTLETAIKIGRMDEPKRQKNVDVEFILNGLGLIYEGRLLNAAVVLFGKSKKLFSLYPQLSLRLAYFKGKDSARRFY